MTAKSFTGVLTAIATPLGGADLRVDERALRAAVERQIEAGVTGIVPCGTTGEFYALSDAERRLVVECTVETVDGRVDVVPQTGALSTGQAVAFSRHAQQSGAAAVLALPPFFMPLSRDGLLRYYSALVEAVDVPVIFYYNPGATGLPLAADEIEELCSAVGIRHVKYTSPDASLMVELLLDYGDRLELLPAWDHLTLTAFLSGARSSIWGAAAVVPELCVELFDACSRDDLRALLEAWRRAAPLFTAFGTLGYVPAVKAASALLGHPLGPPCPPAAPLDPQHHPRLAALLRNAGYDVAELEAAASAT